MSIRYKNTIYSPSPVFYPEPVSSPSTRSTVNISQYRKMIFDYEGTINKDSEKEKRMKRGSSNSNLFIESEKLGIEDLRSSRRKVNINRTQSSIKLG